MTRSPEPLELVNCPESSALLLWRLIGLADREHLVALLLNSRNQVTHAHIVARGTVQSALVHPREVFKAAILANASAMVIGHNHPSGFLDPSIEDREVEKRLSKCGKLLGIPILDFLIVGPVSSYFAASLNAVSEINLPGDLVEST